MEASFDPDARFEKALVRLLNYFNLLELNVGLCISFLANPSEPSNAYPALARMSVEKKVDWLRKLVESKVATENEGALAEFKRWHERTIRARAVRNRYIHGHWEYLPLRHENPVSVRSPGWMREKLGSEHYEEMTVKELEAVVDDIASIFGELMHLRRKYGV